MLAQMDGLLDSVEVTLGLEGKTLHASTGAGSVDVVVAELHIAEAGELGRRGGCRITSTTLGGGGRRGFRRFWRLVLTSSLFPLSSSPAPSSSSPSSAETCVW
jgi:hypothetical protein